MDIIQKAKIEGLTGIQRLTLESLHRTKILKNNIKIKAIEKEMAELKQKMADEKINKEGNPYIEEKKKNAETWILGFEKMLEEQMGVDDTIMKLIHDALYDYEMANGGSGLPEKYRQSLAKLNERYEVALAEKERRENL
jgi:hypothetical protein